MNPLLLLGGVGAVLFLLSRRAAASAPASSDRAQIEQLARAAAASAGVPPGVMFAIIEIESNWNPSATNLTGGDAARGGAYGLTQMTLATARHFEPRITGQELLDPATNLRVAGKLMQDNARRSRDPKDLAAMWNSGKTFDRAPEVTREKYVTRFLSKLSKYQGVA